MAKCQVYPPLPAVYAWQPFGPAEDIYTITELGSHYRGFPVIKISEAAYAAIQGEQTVEFTYKGIKYIATDGKVVTYDEYMKAIIENHNRVLNEFRKQQ